MSTERLMSFDQLKGDFFMLGIKRIGVSTYQVGPWVLNGPAMEKVRSAPLLRTALLLANPNVPNYIKRMFATKPEEI